MKTPSATRFVSVLAVGPTLLSAQPFRDRFPCDTGLLHCIGNRITTEESKMEIPVNVPVRIVIG